MEPGNPSVKEELQKVEALALEHPKRSKTARPAPPLPVPRTRRVPIEIIDVPPTTYPRGDLLAPVSSRPLHRPVLAASLMNTVPIPDAEVLGNEQQEQKPPQGSFHETKQTRGAKYGGGIFRSSGSHTIIKPETSPALRAKPQTDQLPRPPLNIAAFTRSWNTLTTDKHKWTLLQQIPPVSLSGFFGSSLEADILSSILSVLLAVLSAGEAEQSLVEEYMVCLPQVPRFFLIYTFLRRDDKNRAKDILRLLDGAGVTSKEGDGTKELWDA